MMALLLSKGNAGGVIANAELNITRHKDVVAKLMVKNVENNISVADVVPGSLAAGDSLCGGRCETFFNQHSSRTCF
jgi:hypothetical protein